MCSSCAPKEVWIPTRYDIDIALLQLEDDNELMRLFSYCSYIDQVYDDKSNKQAILFYDESLLPLIHSITDTNYQNVTQNNKYLVDITSQHSDIYFMYKLTLDGVYGAKHYEGTWQWKQLKLHQWLSHRLNNNEAEVNQWLDTYNKIKVATSYSKDSFNTIDLVDGYDETTISSCMAGDGSYFYSLKDVGKLLVYDNGIEKGRAILWDKKYLHFDKYSLNKADGFIDRIYPSGNHKIVAAYKQYAKEHNLITKQYQNYDDRKDFIYNDEEYSSSANLTLPKEWYEDMPYMDTFRYGDMDRVTLHNDSSREHIYFFTNTDGSVDSTLICERCGASLNSEEACYNSDGTCYCSNCYNENYSACEYCSEEVYNDRVIYVVGYGYICESCAEHHFYYLKDTEEYSRTYNYTTTDTDNYFKDCDDLFYIEEVDEWYEKESNYLDRLEELKEEKEE